MAFLIDFDKKELEVISIDSFGNFIKNKKNPLINIMNGTEFSTIKNSEPDINLLDFYNNNKNFFLKFRKSIIKKLRYKNELLDNYYFSFTSIVETKDYKNSNLIKFFLFKIDPYYKNEEIISLEGKLLECLTVCSEIRIDFISDVYKNNCHDNLGKKNFYLKIKDIFLENKGNK